MAISLFQHNRDAYEAASIMLAETGKAVIVHPTGTGKSFIGFKLCEDYPDKTICWISPSEYIFKTQIENLKAASKGYAPENVKFFTYAKLMLMDEEEIKDIHPDYIILDEFHRCGAEFWGQGVHNLLNIFQNVPILGLSATNIRYLDNQRDMADELFDGNIASEMTLGEAIVRGILNPPKYVLSVFSYQNDLNRYQKRVHNARSRIVRDKAERYLEALRRALEKADGLDVIFDKHMTDRTGKYIVFCANKEHMDEMITHVSKWFDNIDQNPKIYIAYSSDPETSQAFADFKADNTNHLKLLFCIDMLNEGIHLDDISGVILFRPTVSPIIYKQQIGRAMSASKKNDVVVFDIVNNISNLCSVSSIQEEITEAAEYFRMNAAGDSVVNETFTVIDEVRDCVRLFNELENTLTASWEYMYSEAKLYYEEHGNLLPPSNYVTPTGYSIGSWVIKQRGIYNGSRVGVLTEEQVAKLNQIGMCWLASYERIWEEMFRLAAEYYQNYGNLDIPAAYVTADGEKLGRWYRGCVEEYRKGKLSLERKQRLLSIGFSEESLKVRTWMKYYAEAQKYVNEYGNLNVHADYESESGCKLGIWISSQRYAFSRGRLSQKCIELLAALGMDWQRFDGKWMYGFAHLEAYVKEFGNALVPYNYVTADGYKLGTWTCAQRNKRTKLSKDKIRKLDELGFSWKVLDTAWESSIRAFAEYKETFGQADIPADYLTPQGTSLRVWLINQRSKCTVGKLSDERIEQLNSIDPGWNKSRDNWEAMFSCASKFAEEHGRLTSIPIDYISDTGINLHSWVVGQRKSMKEGKLSQERIDKLLSIGFSLDPLAEAWEQGYEHARLFYEIYGHLSITNTYCSEDGFKLGEWIRGQRRSYKSGKMKTERKARLDEIGMDWEKPRKEREMTY